MRATLIAMSLSIGLTGGACGRPAPADQPVTKSADATTKADESNRLRLTPEQGRDLRITTALVERHANVETVSVAAEVVAIPDRSAEVVPPLSGRVVKLLVGQGDDVQAHQSVAIIDSTELARTRSELAAAESRRTLARATLARKQALVADRIAPAREVQEATADVAAAEAAVAAAASSLQAVGLETTVPPGFSASEYALITPIGGTILERALVLGQVAESSRTAFRVADLSSVWIVAHAAERDAVTLARGATVGVHVPALPDRTMTGTVISVANEADRASGTIAVRVEVANAGRLLRPGMAALVSLPTRPAVGDILTVPIAAVQRANDRWVVFVPRATGEFDVRTVERGRELDRRVEILSGLTVGETIVVDGSFVLKAELGKGRGGEAR
jgi:cobalt-zinc-cadmium efflux system membrane fusion protein